MSISIQKARVLATKPEFTLFRASLPKTLRTLSAAAIKRDVTRARNLRDKYRQLAKKQARSGKEGERTHLKAQMFDEMLERFQMGLKDADKAAKKKATPPGRKKVVRKKKAAPKKESTPKKKAASKKKAVATKKPAAKKKTTSAWFEKPTKKKGAARKKAAKKRGTGPTSKKTTDAVKRSQIERAGRTRKRTHVSARGRRQQAKRDRKG